MEANKQLNTNQIVKQSKNQSTWTMLKKQWRKHKYIYLMLIPVLIFYAVFCYGPMYGLLMAFQDSYSPAKGILGGEWIGFQYFIDFFRSFYFTRLLGNTVMLSLLSLVIGFPAPIILALLLNEVRNKKFKKVVQTISYLPHFISVVVVVGMLKTFTGQDGLFNIVRSMFSLEPIMFLSQPEMFRPIYILSNVWQGAGWASIIFLAALSGIDPQLYEAAKVDGAGRFKQLLNVTLPGILPTIVVVLILRLGGIMNADFQKILLLQNDAILQTSDVISTFVYRQGILNGDFNYSTAIGLFNSVVNFAFLIGANFISKKVNETSLW